MHKYEYTDADGDTLRIMTGYTKGQTVVQFDRKRSLMGVNVLNEDVPTVALELLKAAGQESVIVPKPTGPSHPVWTRNRASELTAIAEAAAREAVEKAEADAEKKLQERREVVLRELGHMYKYDAMGSGSPMQKAVDRIIELATILEDGK